MKNKLIVNSPLVCWPREKCTIHILVVVAGGVNISILSFRLMSVMWDVVTESQSWRCYGRTSEFINGFLVWTQPDFRCAPWALSLAEDVRNVWSKRQIPPRVIQVGSRRRIGRPTVETSLKIENIIIINSDRDIRQSVKNRCSTIQPKTEGWAFCQVTHPPSIHPGSFQVSARGWKRPFLLLINFCQINTN